MNEVVENPCAARVELLFAVASTAMRYPMTGRPPVVAGGVQFRVTVESEVLALSPTTAGAGPIGIAATTDDDVSPYAFCGVTRNRYSTPSVSPVIVYVVMP